jgi:signal transduction histidine kinase
MRINLNWQRKAVIIFTGIILLLSVILIIFAIREAEREKLVREREMEEEQRSSAEFITDQTRLMISEAEGRIFSQIINTSLQPDDHEFVQVCKQIAEDEAIVSAIFYIKGDDTLGFPLLKPLHHSTGEINLRGISPNISSLDAFQNAEDNEFRAKNYAQAIRYYRQVVRSSSDLASRSVLLNHIGRCYSKSGNYRRAIETYREILKIDPIDAGMDGIPVGLIALYQIGNINLNRNKRVEAAETFIEFYQALLESRWPLSRTQFNFYNTKVKTLFKTCLDSLEDTEEAKSSVARWEKLSQLEERRLAEMQTIENISNRIAPLIEVRKTAANGNSGNINHLSEIVGSELYLVAYGHLSKDLVFGITMDAEVLKQDILPSIFKSLPLREGSYVQIRDEMGKVVAGEDFARFQDSFPELGYSQGFEDNFPPWEVQIYQADPGFVQKQLGLIKNIYFVSLAVVIVALLFGGFLAIKSTARELELAKLKAEFVSTVSHEFRTPLTSIRYLSELLQRGRVKGEKKKQDYYQTITHESERLSLLIENILDFSKIEAGMKEYRFEEIEVVDLARDVSSRFREQAAQKEAEFDSRIADQLPKVIADREALSRAILNLMDNALKYSGEDPKITFQAWSDQGNIFFEVRDEGIGIDKKEQAKIFDKFYRTQRAHDTNIKGSGIGLTLVDHIVQAHGGEVFLESEVGKGTKVTIKIPTKNEASKEGDQNG